MSRRSLRPQLNQIRGWVRQGRTDAWIAHQLEVTVQQIQAFKREQGLEADGRRRGRLARRSTFARRTTGDRRRARGRGGPPGRGGGRRRPRRPRKARGGGGAGEAASASEQTDDDEAQAGARRAGGGRAAAAGAGKPLEGTFDHGEEGYGLWLDPDVQDDPVYAEHWAGHRPSRSRSRRTRS